ncbi:regulatory protein RecX [Orbaceae bacterium ESL0721]|nr:regulatory protein RecX [Orbaceae bacterium ESL0721]
MDEQLAKILRNKAVQLLAQRDHSSYELSQKLLIFATKSFLSKKSYEKAAFNDDEIYEQKRAEYRLLIADVISYCTSHGWINDAEYVKKYIDMQVRKGNGRYKIAMELKQRGLQIEIVQSMLSNTYIDWAEVAANQIVKKFKQINKKDQTQKRKIVQFLLSRGFAQDEIKSAYFYCSNPI